MSRDSYIQFVAHLQQKGGDNPMQPDNSQPTEPVIAPVEPAIVEPQAPTIPDQQAIQQDAIDYKTKYEDSERRRAGLDRKLSRIASQGTRNVSEENLFTVMKKRIMPP